MSEFKWAWWNATENSVSPVESGVLVDIILESDNHYIYNIPSEEVSWEDMGDNVSQWKRSKIQNEQYLQNK